MPLTPRLLDGLAELPHVIERPAAGFLGKRSKPRRGVVVGIRSGYGFNEYLLCGRHSVERPEFLGINLMVRAGSGAPFGRRVAVRCRFLAHVTSPMDPLWRVKHRIPARAEASMECSLYVCRSEYEFTLGRAASVKWTRQETYSGEREGSRGPETDVRHRAGMPARRPGSRSCLTLKQQTRNSRGALFFGVPGFPPNKPNRRAQAPAVTLRARRLCRIKPTPLHSAMVARMGREPDLNRRQDLCCAAQEQSPIVLHSRLVHSPRTHK